MVTISDIFLFIKHISNMLKGTVYTILHSHITTLQVSTAVDRFQEAEQGEKGHFTNLVVKSPFNATKGNFSIHSFMFLHLKSYHMFHSVNKPAENGKLLSQPHQGQRSRLRENSYTP